MTSRPFRNGFLLAAAAIVAGCAADGNGPDLSKIRIGDIVGGQHASKINAAQTVGTGVIDAELLTEADEDELGRTVAIAATNQWPLFDKPALNKYVTLVGLTVADASARPGGTWVFGVLDTPEVGAFSGPNGYVMVTRGALDLMQDEAELAAVLAHEVAHVVAGHGLDAVKAAKRNEAALKGLSELDQRAAVFNQYAGVIVDKALRSGWNQGQETAADQAAVRLLVASGYDPNGLSRFFQRVMQRQGTGSGKLFGTHPGTADRIARTTAQIKAAPPARPGATNRDRFAKAVAEAKL
jgi:predicted Zn-dependent protease